MFFQNTFLYAKNPKKKELLSSLLRILLFRNWVNFMAEKLETLIWT